MIKSFLKGFLRGIVFMGSLGAIVLALGILLIAFMKSIFLGVIIVGVFFGVLNILDDIGGI